MTTIVYADYVLAADGRITCRGSIQSETTIKLFVPEEQGEGTWAVGGESIFTYGYAGGQSTLEWAIHQLKSRGDLADPTNRFDPPMETSFQMLLVTATGVWKWEIEKNKEEEYQFLMKVCDYNESYAIGSGAAYAEAGLSLQLNAIKCVELASKRCIYTGGEIFYVDIGKGPLRVKRVQKPNII